MKFTKELRDKVKIGTKFTDSYAKYVVTNMWTSWNGRGISVTLKCLECSYPNHEWMTGRQIYGYRLSDCYGMEMEV